MTQCFKLSSLVLSLGVVAVVGALRAADDWPQYRGPSRQGIAADGVKLADAWPKDGPKQLWKSEWIPGAGDGGAGSPVVADGKVYLYVNWMHPVGGGRKYHLITTEFLQDAGWLPDLPAELAKKIEDAWAAPAHPPCSKAPAWWGVVGPKDEEFDAFLAKAPDVDKYIKDFMATLPAADAQKYGKYIKRRLCISGPKTGWNPTGGYTWDELEKMSKTRDEETEFAWNYKKRAGSAQILNKGAFDDRAGWLISNIWLRASTLTDTLVCLDAATGKVLWKREYPATRERVLSCLSMDKGGFGQIGASGTPTIADGKCYFAGIMGLYCISAKDGTPIWNVEGEATHNSPLVAKGIVYHYGAAYNAADGKLLWKHPQWKPNLGAWEVAAKANAPILWTVNSKDYIITTNGNHDWCCLELETGKVLWTVRGAPDLYSPVFKEDLLILRGATQVEAFKATPAAATSLWKQAVKMDSRGSYTIVNDALFMLGCPDAGAMWTCLDLKTGDVKWSQAIPGETLCNAAATVDGKLINVFGKGHYDSNFQVEMIDATPEKYVQRGLFNPKACVYSCPAIAGGKLFLRLEDGVACYDLQGK